MRHGDDSGALPPDLACLRDAMREARPTEETLGQTLAAISEEDEDGQARDTLLEEVSPGRYDDGAHFDSGGMGQLREATDRRLRRAVLIKELQPERLEKGASRRRFEREIFISSGLQHPGIVNVHDGGCWPSGEPFYAMERVQGRDFSEVIGALQTLDERLSRLKVVVDVANAMAYAHSQGVIHRDLKPSNVLVGRFGETVVIDWGLAKLIGEAEDIPQFQSLEGVLSGDQTRDAGTLAYMPPEQAAGDAAQLDERADVFAIGAILYHLVSGRPWPAALEGRFSIRAFAASRQVPRPVHEVTPGIPPALATIIHTAMASDPEARYRDAGALAEELQRFTAGQLVRSHRYSAGELLRHWLARHRALALTGGAAAVVLAVVISMSFAQVTHERDKNAAQRDEIIKQRDEIIKQRDENAHQRDENGRQRDRIAANLEQIRDLSRGQLSLRGADIGASIEVDGRPRGVISGLDEASTLALDPGPHTLTIRRAGHLDETRQVNLKPQEQKTITVLLRTEATGSPEGMVEVAAGPFIMGSDDSVDQRPPREVTLRGFFIDQREVRVAEYQRCVDATRCTSPTPYDERTPDLNWRAPGRAEHPVNGVTWHQAAAYCAWLGKRLPTEAEWEKSARGVDGRRYPWGDAPATCARAIMWDHSGIGCGHETTWPVSARPDGASPYSALDVAGNIAEWTADWYHEGYYAVAPASAPPGPASGLQRVARGGSFGVGKDFHTTTHRLAFSPENASSDVGFRCAWSLTAD